MQVEELNQTISVTFWLSDDVIFSFWTNTYPSYKKGESVYLSRSVTPIGAAKYKHVKEMSGSYVVKSIVHGLAESVQHDISVLHRMEIHLKEAS